MKDADRHRNVRFRQGVGSQRVNVQVETLLNRGVQPMQLIEAQRQVATDWLAVYRENGLQPQ